MHLKFITPTVHGLLDYAAATALIVLPVVLQLGQTSALAVWLSVAGGAGLVAYSLLTDYAFGPIGVLPFRIHLALDLAAAVAFLAAPLVFGWNGLVAAYYAVMGGGVIVVVLLSQSAEARPAPSSSGTVS